MPGAADRGIQQRRCTSLALGKGFESDICSSQPITPIREHAVKPFVLFAALILLAGLPLDRALACEPEGKAVLSLRVTPGELAEPRRTLAVTVFENDCVQVRRPVHYRNAGLYRFGIEAAERAGLETLRREPALREFDAKTVLSKVSDLQQGRGEGGSRELFEVHDADHYVLSLQDADGERVIRFDAVFQYSDHYPELAELKAMAALVDRLQGLARDERLLSAGRAGARTEVQP